MVGHAESAQQQSSRARSPGVMTDAAVRHQFSTNTRIALDSVSHVGLVTVKVSVAAWQP